MAQQQFRVRGGLKSDANVTLSGTPTNGTVATGGKILNVDNNANVHSRTFSQTKGDIDAGALDGVVAGNGITVTAKQGGGAGTDTQTITLGTPDTLTATTTDSATTGSHTHAITSSNDTGTATSAVILAANSTGGLKVNNFSTAGVSTFTGNATFNANVTIDGTLFVDGTLTYVNATNLSVSDPLITLSVGGDGVAPLNDQGILINRGTSANVAMIWDESEDEFIFMQTTAGGTDTGNLNVSDYMNIHAGTIKADDQVNVTGTTASSNTSTGAITTAGGLGVQQSIHGNTVTAAHATNATSNTTGSLQSTGGLGVALSAVVGGDLTVHTDVYHKDIARTLVSSATIADGANAFLFQIPIANYSAGEAILKMKAGTNETAIHKYLFCESGSGAVENNEYGTLGHAISATITFEMTDGSGSAGSTPIGMKVANADGISITAKVEATFFSV